MLKRIYNKFNNGILKLRFKLLKYRNPGLVQKGKINLTGLPLIRAVEGSIIVGDNVTLRSENKTYFLNMYAPTKLYTSTQNAQIIIGENTRINGSCLHSYEKIQIGKNCLIASNCQIFDTNRHDLSFEDPSKRLINSVKTKPVLIDNNVWIGTNTIILPGVTIGEGSVVAAGSVVTKDILPYTLNGGNPCKEIKQFSKNM